MTRFLGFAADVQQELEAAIEHLTDHHHDTLAFVATPSDSAQEITQCRVESIAPTRVSFELSTASGTSARVVAFSDSVTEASDLQGEMFRMLATARSLRPDHPETSIERELRTTTALQTYVTAVSARRQLTPNLIELTLSGGLDGLPVMGDDEFILLMPPAPGTNNTIRADFEKPDFRNMEAEDRPPVAYYTSRRRRPIDGEVDVWFVIHGHPGGVSGWAADARIGDPLAVWGPRTSFKPPADTCSYMLICDESGFAAVASILEGLAPETEAHVIAETVDEDHQIDFPSGPFVTVDWVYRGSAAQGTSGRLLDAVLDYPLTTGRPYVFGAAESRELAGIRRHVRGTVGLDQQRVDLVGYWRRSDELGEEE